MPFSSQKFATEIIKNTMKKYGIIKKIISKTGKTMV